ncbi:MAG: winged helix DNA-binding domain-containing protein [Bacteroidota bacterium]
MIDTNSIASRRYSRQFPATKPLPKAQPLLQQMGAMQAQDYEMMLWAIACRTGETRSQIERQFEEGLLIRSYLLRPTWQVVSAEQYASLLALSAPRIRRSLQARHRKLEIDGALLRRTFSLLEQRFAKQIICSRAELRHYLEQAKIDLSQNRLYHLLLCAALEGIICGAKPEGREQRYRLLSLTKNEGMGEAESLALLAEAYFRYRGPATLADFAWWAGLKRKEAREAIASLGQQLGVETIHKVEYYDWIDQPPTQAGLCLLPAYDELTIAYPDKQFLLHDPTNLPQISRSGVFYPLIIEDGRAIGNWKLTKEDQIKLTFFDGGAPPSREALEQAVSFYAHFVERSVTIEG